MKNVTYYNAGAGSGKTYKLTEILYDEIVSGNCKASEVILTTFTVAAANEIKERARAKLLKEGRVEEANELNSALIGTVHSVAFQLLQQYWDVLGQAVNPELIMPVDESIIINQSLSEIISEKEERQLSRLCTEIGFKNSFSSDDPYRWKTDLQRILAKSNVYFINDFFDSKKASLEKLEQAFSLSGQDPFSIDSNELSSILSELKKLCQEEKESKAKNSRLDTIKGFLAQSKFGDSQKAQVLKFIDDLPQKSHTERSKALVGKYEVFYMQFLRELLKEYMSLLLGIAERVQSEYISFKNDNKVIDYNDMELQFAQLLDKKELKEEISDRYKLILVDEFQDSSPIQVMIFNALSEIIKRSIWVGDLKQSIYGFRGSDPDLIKMVLKEIEKGANGNELKNVLTTSYRSRPALVEHVNKLFVPAFSIDLPKPEMVRLEACDKRKAHEAQFNNKAALIHWHFNNDNNRVQSVPYELLASEVKRLLDSDLIIFDKKNDAFRPIEAQDVCLLTHTNDDVIKISAELEDLGITVSISGTDLLDSFEVKLLIALLRLTVKPNDALSRSEIAYITESKNLNDLLEKRAVFNQRDNAETHEWLSENSLIKQLAEMNENWSRYSIVELVEKVVAITHLKNQVAIWGQEKVRASNIDYVQSLTDIYQNRCIYFNIATSVDGFIDFLESMAAYDKSFGRMSVAEDNAVNVMTYHKSKGLEWPVVLLDRLENDKLSDRVIINKNWFGIRMNSSEELSVADPFSNRKLLFLPTPWKSNVKNEVVFENVMKSEDFKDVQAGVKSENIRLSYVAMTRARDYLISASINKKEPILLQNIFDKGQIGNGFEYGKLDGVLEDWYAIGEKNVLFSYLDRSDYQKPEIDAKKANFYDAPRAEAQNDPLQKSPSAEMAVSADVKIEKNFDHKIHKPVALNDQYGVLGDLLHQIFYLYSPTIGVDEMKHKIKEILNNAIFNFTEEASDQVYTAIKNLYDYLETTQGVALNVYKELALQASLDGYLYKGEADLVYETKGGFILIDYKSFPGVEAQITNKTNEFYAGKYSGQLNAYAAMIEKARPDKKVIKKLIYYSMTGLLVELNS